MIISLPLPVRLAALGKDSWSAHLHVIVDCSGGGLTQRSVKGSVLQCGLGYSVQYPYVLENSDELTISMPNCTSGPRASMAAICRLTDACLLTLTLCKVEWS